MRPGRTTLIACVLAVACLPGCALNGLAFKIDDRVTIVSPADRETVSLPITIDWEIEDFEVTGPDKSGPSEAEDRQSGYFGIFVDRAPQPPGETVKVIAKDDRSCHAEDGCPSRKYLADRGVFTTTETKFVLETLPPPSDDEARRRELHEVTIVLLDSSGRRIGESAFISEFEVKR